MYKETYLNGLQSNSSKKWQKTFQPNQKFKKLFEGMDLYPQNSKRTANTNLR